MSSAVDDEQFIQVLSEKWTDHKVTMMMTRDILMYMDRTYVAQFRQTPIYDVGLEMFYQYVAGIAPVKERLHDLIMRWIEKERSGELIDRSLLKNILSMLADLGVNSNRVYEADFEASFLETTKQFYKQESQEYLDRNTCPDYLRKIEIRLREEHERVTHYLNASTEPKLKRIVETELIANHASILVNMEGSGCRVLIRDDKIDDLALMFNLFSRVPQVLVEIRRVMQKYVGELGDELVDGQQHAKDAGNFVRKLLDMRSKFAKVVEIAFQNDNECQKALKIGFEGFMNRDRQCAAHLAQYVDTMLRSGTKDSSEESIETRLDKVVTLFRYLQDKDIFEDYYKRHLSKRLLANKSESEEAEKSMIARLKTECGYHFTSKLEGMFKDMRMAKDTMDLFRRENPVATGQVDLQVNVLTSGFWPVLDCPPIPIPREVASIVTAFETHYLSKHSGRRLNWQTNMGTAEVKAKLNSATRFEFVVSTYQMFILLLFNTTDELTFKQIQEATQIPESECRRHLISMCTPKVRVFTKSNKGKSIEAQDTVKLNMAYESNRIRRAIPLISQKDPTVQLNEVPSSVEEDRKHLVEAAIVRIMKARKTFDHNNLVAEVTRQLSTRFVPAPQLIKRRIESLIEREYLERSEKDRRVYNYLA